MPTITRSALQWLQDELESKEAQVAELEEELEAALEDNAALKGQLILLRQDRNYNVGD